MRYKSFILFVVFIITHLYSQITVEPDVATDSIDVFAVQSGSVKSTGLASIATIILPGLGHQYLGNTKKAMGYYTAEMAFIFSLIYCERYSKKLFSDSKSYAFLYGHVSYTGDPDDSYWKNVGNFMESDQYYTMSEQNRDFNSKDEYLANNFSWHWDDEFFQDKYNDIRKDGTKYHVAVSFFLGAMILNRVVSFVDVRKSSRHKGIRGNLSIDFLPQFNIADASTGLTVSAKF